MTNLIERMARAHWNIQLAMGDLLYEDQSPAARLHLESRMRAAWAVAAEPTDAMLNRAEEVDGDRLKWQAMHGAADD